MCLVALAAGKSPAKAINCVCWYSTHTHTCICSQIAVCVLRHEIPKWPDYFLPAFFFSSFRFTHTHTHTHMHTNISRLKSNYVCNMNYTVQHGMCAASKVKAIALSSPCPSCQHECNAKVDCNNKSALQLLLENRNDETCYPLKANVKWHPTNQRNSNNDDSNKSYLFAGHEERKKTNNHRRSPAIETIISKDKKKKLPLRLKMIYRCVIEMARSETNLSMLCACVCVSRFHLLAESSLKRNVRFSTRCFCCFCRVIKQK